MRSTRVNMYAFEQYNESRPILYKAADSYTKLRFVSAIRYHFTRPHPSHHRAAARPFQEQAIPPI